MAETFEPVSNISRGNLSASLSIAAPAAIFSVSFIALISVLLASCVVWLIWRRFVLERGPATVIGYGSSKEFRSMISGQLAHIANLKPDLRSIYQQFGDQAEDDNFFRRQVLLDTANFAHELKDVCPSIDPNGSLEDCIQTAVNENVVQKTILDRNPEMLRIYRMCRFEAGPITQAHYNEFSSLMKKLRKTQSEPNSPGPISAL